MEATYHKMLVQTPPDRRLEAVRAVSKMLGETSGLLSLTWLGETEGDGTNDMALLIM